MRTAIVVLLAALGARSVAGQAQRETFDLASFVPPAGWQRTEGKDLLVFVDQNPRQGRPSQGQIVLFRSRPTEGAPLDDWRADWKRKVADRMKGAPNPTIDSSVSKTGRKDITGFVAVGKGVEAGTSLLITS